MRDLAPSIFAIAAAIAALAIVAANLRFRRLHPGAPDDETGLSFTELVARRSIYGLVFSGHHRRLGDRPLTVLVYLSRATVVAAVLAGLYWKLWA